MIKLNDLYVCISVNGTWSDWSVYGGCKGRCGTGEQTRTRACDNPAPKWGGADCVGKSKQSTSCELTPCVGESNFRFRVYFTK